MRGVGQIWTQTEATFLQVELPCIKVAFLVRGTQVPTQFWKAIKTELWGNGIEKNQPGAQNTSFFSVRAVTSLKQLPNLNECSWHSLSWVVGTICDGHSPLKGSAHWALCIMGTVCHGYSTLWAFCVIETLLSWALLAMSTQCQGQSYHGGRSDKRRNSSSRTILCLL